MPKGPSTTQYIGGIVADQLSKMVATIIGSSGSGLYQNPYLCCRVSTKLVLCKMAVDRALLLAEEQ